MESVHFPKFTNISVRGRSQISHDQKCFKFEIEMAGGGERVAVDCSEMWRPCGAVKQGQR